MRNRKASYIVSVIFVLIFSIGLFVAGFFINKKNNNIIDNGVKTQATISQITVTRTGDEYTYRVYVEYTVEDQTYNNELGSYYTGMAEGQTIDIWYLKTDPNQITDGASSSFVPIVTYSLGGVLLLVAGFMIFIKVRGTGLEKLKNTGRKVTAVVTEVRISQNFAVNRIYPWKIFCEYGDEKFKTPNVYDDPPNIKAGDSIDVYKSENGKKYYIDVKSAKENENNTNNNNGRLL